ncbi:MAG: carbon-nitrogen hydrolase family protein, partial [Erythrobacter sp.]|nr:carbon-nitrogen hydrolase family protein [Erythrobacter sp.]
MPRIALLQMTSGVDPAANAREICQAAERAAGEGASMLFTPEMAGLIDRNRQRAAASIVAEADNPQVDQVARAAADNGVWIAYGLPVAREDGRWANRTLVFDPAGQIAARYDKIHMFDV